MEQEKFLVLCKVKYYDYSLDEMEDCDVAPRYARVFLTVSSLAEATKRLEQYYGKMIDELSLKAYEDTMIEFSEETFEEVEKFLNGEVSEI